MSSPIITTNRLYLRELTIDDAQDFFLLNENPLVVQYTGDGAFASLAEAERFLLNYDQYDRYGYGRWAVLDKQTHKFLGWCGLKMNEEGFVDIGYRFFEEYWGNGYATESAQACLEYGLTTLQLPFIVGRTARQNTASVRVLEKIGMQFWKEDQCKGIQDSLYYRIDK